MIKRIRFARHQAGVAAGDLVDGWRRALDVVAGAPPDVRPARIALCVAVPEVSTDPRYDAVGLEWFADAEHLRRSSAWLAGADGAVAAAALAAALDLTASPVVEAEEHVERGADWLEDRWRRGGARCKHMAIARRAEGLTPAQFSERWSGRAGQVSGPGGAAPTVIPDDVRGCAYVQNHPRPRPGGEWPFDAVNEVWFDDVEGLRRRVRWFEALGDRPEEDLVGEHWFLALTEELLFPVASRPTGPSL